MAKSTPQEHDLLRLLTTKMDESGLPHHAVSINIDQSAVDLMNEELGYTVTLNELTNLADKCKSRQWLVNAFVSSDKYENLTLTPTGHGVVRSLAAKEKAKAERSRLKKLSDFIDDHKGLLTALAVLLTLVGLLTKNWGTK